MEAYFMSSYGPFTLKVGNLSHYIITQFTIE